MFKLKNKIQFNNDENRMRYISEVNISRLNYKKSKNLDFLLRKRFEWMNNFIEKNDVGIEVGSGIGFSKDYIENENLKITDISSGTHLDFKNIDAQNTGFADQSFNYVIASNMVHHVPYPVKFFREMNRILKKNGRLIIFEPYCSILFQLVTIIMKHEGFDFTIDPWDENNPKSSEEDAWHGNIAVPNMMFDDKKKFKNYLGKYFEFEFEKLTECIIFLNSGGVTSKTFYLPMSYFFLSIVDLIDKFLVKIAPNIFCLGRQIVLIKK
tara:strand:+ start:569 stop:1369 length:801 start_codon:yes stop_codon:yes gene_type:complete